MQDFSQLTDNSYLCITILLFFTALSPLRESPSPWIRFRLWNVSASYAVQLGLSITNLNVFCDEILWIAIILQSSSIGCFRMHRRILPSLVEENLRIFYYATKLFVQRSTFIYILKMMIKVKWRSYAFELLFKTEICWQLWRHQWCCIFSTAFINCMILLQVCH